MKYFAYSGENLLALVGFGASAWRIAPRDYYIGWSDVKRQKNLQLVVNNARFLILPWVDSKNLASKILSMITRRIAEDWLQRYKYTPVLLETFVEKQRYSGTCYKAANWKLVGTTKGRGKKTDSRMRTFLRKISSCFRFRKTSEPYFVESVHRCEAAGNSNVYFRRCHGHHGRPIGY